MKGDAYVVFGVERNGEKVRLASMKHVKDVSETLKFRKRCVFSHNIEE